jgi:signal transduction histidine kinase
MIPVIVQVVFPDDPSLTDELVWLVTLAPAFLLSLHYGLPGALLSLVLGTALFVAVQLTVALNYTPDDWRITVPIYIAYGALAISVGWLSEQLHGYYKRVMQDARMAAIGQIALTMKHEINNALTPLVTETELLLENDADLNEKQRNSIDRIKQSAFRISSDLDKITRLEDAPTAEFFEGVEMIDLSAARVRLDLD